MSLLQQAVNTISDLRKVKTTVETLAAQTTTTITYDMYYSLLCSAATNYDNEQDQKSRGIRGKGRNLNMTSANDASTQDFNDEIPYDLDQSVDFTIDMSPSKFLQINETRGDHRSKFGSKFGSKFEKKPEVRLSLPKAIWEILTDTQKEAVLAHNRGIRSQTHGQGPPPFKPRSTNEHIGDWSVNTDDQTIPTTDSTRFSTDHSTVRFDMNQSETSKSDSGFSREPQPNSGNSFISNLSEGRTINQIDIKNVLSSNTPTSSSTKTSDDMISFQGHQWARISTCAISSSPSKPHQATHSLVDRGANNGIAGNDVRVLSSTNRKINIQGIDNHHVSGLDIVTAAGKVMTTLGPIIVILHQYAYLGHGPSIHSSAQMEHNNTDVCDKSKQIKDGKQRILTMDGNIIPLKLRHGLVYMDLSVPSDQDLQVLPQTLLTSASTWNPSILDGESDPPALAMAHSKEPYTDTPIFDNTAVGETTSMVHMVNTTASSEKPGNKMVKNRVINPNLLWQRRQATKYKYNTPNGEVYCRQPKAYLKNSNLLKDKEEHIIVINKALYGLGTPRTTSQGTIDVWLDQEKKELQRIDACFTLDSLCLDNLRGANNTPHNLMVLTKTELWGAGPQMVLTKADLWGASIQILMMQTKIELWGANIGPTKLWGASTGTNHKELWGVRTENYNGNLQINKRKPEDTHPCIDYTALKRAKLAYSESLVVVHNQIYNKHVGRNKRKSRDNPTHTGRKALQRIKVTYNDPLMTNPADILTKHYEYTDDFLVVNPTDILTKTLTSTNHQDKKEITYKAMIGKLYWLIALGQMDLLVNTRSLSKFIGSHQPRHFLKLKVLYEYAHKQYPTQGTNITSSLARASHNDIPVQTGKRGVVRFTPN
jgi:hypothetical protein